MRVILCENYDEISKEAAKLISGQVALKPNSVLGLATGSTPVGMYERLAEMYKNGDIDFSKVVTFNLDEYYPISQKNDQSYHYFMQENLFSKINVSPENIHIPNGETKNPKKECADYEASIEEHGGIDLQVLGIGRNGHIGFNEPSSNLISVTHLTDLTEDTIEANSRFFDSPDDVPRQALTMGMATILKSKKIILLASGESKREVVSELLTTGINTSVPATILKVHPDVVLICDKEAYGNGIYLGIDIGGTNAAFGIVNESGDLLCKGSVPTGNNIDDIVKKTSDAVRAMMEEKNISMSSVATAGIGSAGLIDRKNGTIIYASNLNMRDVNIAKKFEDELGIPFSLENDANAAAYGEYIKSGADCSSFIFITFGTGIGGGIVINGEIYRGFNGIGAEFGHTTLYRDGKECICGRKGCWEMYASATALIEQTKEAIEKHPDSAMKKIADEQGGVSGMTAFLAAKAGDKYGQEVVEQYVQYVSEGIINIINIFQPQKIVLGGGISNEGDYFLNPVKEYIRKYSQSSALPQSEIEIATLFNDAGIIGAALAAKHVKE